MTQDPPPILYKYVRPERLPGILQDGLVRFTQANALADYFEFKPVFDIIRSTEDFSDELLRDQDAILADCLAKLVGPEQVSVFLPAVRRAARDQRVFEQIRSSLAPLVAAMFQRLREQWETVLRPGVGIFSVTEDACSSVMWDYYADGHRGAVLALDTRPNWFGRPSREEFFHLQRVHYVDVVNRSRLFRDILVEPNPAITKGRSYDHEREWRMLAPTAERDSMVGSTEDPVFLFRMNPQALRSIVFGTRASNGLKEDIAQLARSREQWSHVRFQQVQSRGSDLELT